MAATKNGNTPEAAAGRPDEFFAHELVAMHARKLNGPRGAGWCMRDIRPEGGVGLVNVAHSEPVPGQPSWVRRDQRLATGQTWLEVAAALGYGPAELEKLRAEHEAMWGQP
jgi:hypothetical protein